MVPIRQTYDRIYRDLQDLKETCLRIAPRGDPVIIGETIMHFHRIFSELYEIRKLYWNGHKQEDLNGQAPEATNTIKEEVNGNVG